jgi:pyruvate dehydrogenase E2 component (dihydrolipoamide acetyltransferase)
MITKVFMPKLSEAMETGKVIQWLKKEGDPVKGGDVIAEIETDKANVEVEAFGSGVLRKILVGPGGTVPVGEMIGVIADPADDVSGLAAAPSKPAAPAAPVPEASAPAASQIAPSASGPTGSAPAASPPAPAPEGPAAAVPAMETYRSTPATTAVVPMTPAPAAAAVRTSGERVKASPLARKIAAQSGVDLHLVQGSGPGGRIVRRDVETASAQGPAAAPAGSAAPVAQPAGRPAFTIPPRTDVEFEDVALTPMRAIIAKRMPLSKAPVPHFYVTTEVAMDRAMDLRAELNGLEGQPKISVTDLVIKAVALALIKNPGVNASLVSSPQAPTAPGAPPTQVIRKYHRAHLGIAVALDEGLITPVLRDCDAKPLSRIAVEARDLAERARAGKLRVPEMSGATFSISNLGMYDVDEFSAIINPPEGAILAVGSVVETPVVDKGEIRVGRRMKLTISCDHRVMDGAMGARFLQDVKRVLEEPLRLLA